MVISVEEVMESGHFYGPQDLPPELLQLVNMLILLPFSLACSSEEFELGRSCVKGANRFLILSENKAELHLSEAFKQHVPVTLQVPTVGRRTGLACDSYATC